MRFCLLESADREIIGVCSEIHTKHINTPCAQNEELVNVKLAVHIANYGALNDNQATVSVMTILFQRRKLGLGVQLCLLAL